MKRLTKASSVLSIIGILLILLGGCWLESYWMLKISITFYNPSIPLFIGISLLVLGFIAIGYGVYKRKHTQQLSLIKLILLAIGIWIGFIAILSYIIYDLYGELDKGIFYFIALHIIVSLLIEIYLFSLLTQRIQRTRRLFPYVFSVVLMPILVYWGTVCIGMSSLICVVGTIITTIYFLALILIQIAFILKKDKGFRFFPDSNIKRMRYSLCTILYLFALPLVGFYINSGSTLYVGIDSTKIWGSGVGFVGDFSHPIFLVLTLINVIIFLLPNSHNPLWQKLHFYGKIVGFSFITYMLVAFIPIMPLGIIGILFWGLGLLAFIPLLAFIWEGYYVMQEVRNYWKQEGRSKTSLMIGVGALTLPILFGTLVFYDTQNLARATQCANGEAIGLYVDKASLKRTLEEVATYSPYAIEEFPFNMQMTPILSSLYYRGLTSKEGIGEERIKRLEKVYFDTRWYALNEGEEKAIKPGDLAVQLADIQSVTRYDEEQNVYYTWIDLTITNTSNEGLLEYATTFELPEGVYVTDYYLQVGEKRKQGILSDERAATSIYEGIVSRALDPGILKYWDENYLELRVFPFTNKETRFTGFELQHKASFELLIDGRTIEVEVPNQIAIEPIRTLGKSGVTLLEYEGITTLPVTQRREPHYYFLIDGSYDADLEGLLRRTQDYIEANHLEEAKVYLVGEEILAEGVESIATIKEGRGGYNLNGAMQAIMRNEETGYYPVFIAVSDAITQAALPYGIQKLLAEYPECVDLAVLETEGVAIYDVRSGNMKLQQESSGIINYQLRQYKGKSIVDNGIKQYIFEQPLETFESTGNRYEDACLLEAMAWYLEDRDNEALLQLVKGSFKAKVLTPYTAFIVVETKEQERALQALQSAYLKGNEIGTHSKNMAEPPMWLCLVICVGWGYISKRRFNSN